MALTSAVAVPGGLLAQSAATIPSTRDQLGERQAQIDRVWRCCRRVGESKPAGLRPSVMPVRAVMAEKLRGIDRRYRLLTTGRPRVDDSADAEFVWQHCGGSGAAVQLENLLDKPYRWRISGSSMAAKRRWYGQGASSATELGRTSP